MTMNPLSPTALSGLLPQASGYHTAEDALRMQALVRALLEGRRPIALSSPDATTLAHYSRLLVRDLRQCEGVRIIAHLPGNHDKLVQQVNDLLADVPLADVVRRDTGSTRPTHVFVVHDSPDLTASEFSLLVRLVGDLPGANLRLVLIQDRDLAVSGCLQALGPQALHWHIQNSESGADALPEASRQARKVALKEALLEEAGTLPAWAQPAAPRRRWRLAFWRRRETQGTSGQAAQARAPAVTRRVDKHVSPVAPRNTLRAATGKARQAPPTAAPVNAQARRNRWILVSGVLLSAALAGTMGAWLSMHQPTASAARQGQTPGSGVTTLAGR